MIYTYLRVPMGHLLVNLPDSDTRRLGWQQSDFQDHMYAWRLRRSRRPQEAGGCGCWWWMMNAAMLSLCTVQVLLTHWRTMNHEFGNTHGRTDTQSWQSRQPEYIDNFFACLLLMLKQWRTRASHRSAPLSICSITTKPATYYVPSYAYS